MNSITEELEKAVDEALDNCLTDILAEQVRCVVRDRLEHLDVTDYVDVEQIVKEELE